MANPNEAVGQEVQQKPTQEGVGVEGGHAGDVAVGAVFPAEGHVAVVEGDQPIVGDGDAMGVAGEICEHLIGAGEGRLAVHDPALGRGALEQVLRVVIASQGNRAARDRVLELGQELAAEDLGEDAHGQEEVRAGGDPARVAGIQTAAGDDAVQMRVEEQELGPGVQDGGEGDLDAEPTAGDLRQGLGDRGEEQAVGHPGGGAEEVVQLGGDGEDDMEVRDGQQIAALRFEPPRFLEALALGAMPIPTGVVRDLLMPALRARAPVAPSAAVRHSVRARRTRC